MTTTTAGGPRIPRVDAHDKVTGNVHYGADRLPDGVLHGALATAPVGRGRLVTLHTAAARASDGVRLVLTGPAPDGLRSAGFQMAGGHGFQSVQPLVDDQIFYRGQPVALVVADSFHQAARGAELISGEYVTEPVAATIDADGTETVDQDDAVPVPAFHDISRGAADAALAAAPVRVDEEFDCPTQHASPMELMGCVVEWDGGRLTVWEGTQNANAVRFGLATALGIDAADVRVISPYVGGGFGNKTTLQCFTALAAIAARRLDRPVKLVLTRSQHYLSTSFRPASHHRVRLGATPDGRLLAAIHEVAQQTSRSDSYPANYLETTTRVYDVADYRGHQQLVRTDTPTPGYMRGPHEGMAAFAFEGAVDELALRCGVDPVELRLRNDTATDPATGRPFSSRYVATCLRRGAELFGWSGRDPRPGSMRAPDGAAVGWGVAVGSYPTDTVAAICRMTATADGRLVVHAGAHEMGQGIRTAITALVVEDLGIPVDRLVLDVGDTRVVPQHLTAGSWGTATVLPGVRRGLARLRAELGLAPGGAVDLGAAVRAGGRDEVRVEVETLGPGQDRGALDQLRSGHMALSGPEYPDFTTFSYVAHFVEVRVEAGTCRIRVPRVVSVVDCGRVMSPVTAESQVRGGVIWGLGQALREVSAAEPTYGGFLNDNLADYVVPVMADHPDTTVDFVDEPDFGFNETGVKSLGEVVMIGVSAAIANAVHHATGRRFRRLPIRIDDLFAPPR